MRAPLARFYLIALFVGMTAFLATQVDSQEGALAQPAVGPEPVPEGQKGVEVMARGPVHEAYAAPTAEAKPTQAIPKKPPTPLWQPFTERARRAVHMAHEEARRLGHTAADTQDLLYGIVRSENLASGVLERMGVSLEKVQEEIARRFPALMNSW